MVRITIIILSLLATGCSTLKQEGGLNYLNVRPYVVPPTYTTEHNKFNVFLYNNALQGNMRF